MQEILQRARLLLQQHRHDLAETEARRFLTHDPDSAPGHALLALCLLQRKDYAAALAESSQATSLDPADPYNHFVRAAILLETERPDEALAAANHAISIAPFNPDYHALVAAVHLKRRRWTDALDAAQRGLESDPEHVDSNNYRVIALVNLGRRAEAAASMGSTLTLAPEDAYSHANQGWTLLHQGNPTAALPHFQEALRLNPNLDWARAGIVESLKAKNFLYRRMLAYFLFMSRISRRAQWSIIFGGWIGTQLLRNLARQYPALDPVITPLIVAYVIFVVLTWLAYPFFNLLLRLSRVGRLALSREQTIAANFVGATLLLTALLAAAALYTGRPLLIELTVMAGLLTLPVSAFFNTPRGWPRLVIAAAIATLLAIAATHTHRFLHAGPNYDQLTQDDYNHLELLSTYATGILLTTLLASFLTQARIKKA